MNTEKLSKWILWGLMGITIVSFALFMLVGYDTPYEENPKQNAPLLTDLILCLCFAFTFIAAALTVWSAILQITKGGSTSKDEGMAGKTGLISTIALVASLAIGAIVGFSNSGERLLINGKDWNNPTDIIMTDMSIISIAILMVLTIVAVVYSMVVRTKK
jgi:sterol desaturase/sphingolipid hydroxylase (fatty acid hydroxylase superfamily)